MALVVVILVLLAFLGGMFVGAAFSSGLHRIAESAASIEKSIATLVAHHKATNIIVNAVSDGAKT